MHVQTLLLLLVTLFANVQANIPCVAIWIDGYYPLYRSEACAIESSPFNTATSHTCSRFQLQQRILVAPCSTGS